MKTNVKGVIAPGHHNVATKQQEPLYDFLKALEILGKSEQALDITDSYLNIYIS